MGQEVPPLACKTTTSTDPAIYGRAQCAVAAAAAVAAKHASKQVWPKAALACNYDIFLVWLNHRWTAGQRVVWESGLVQGFWQGPTLAVWVNNCASKAVCWSYLLVLWCMVVTLVHCTALYLYMHTQRCAYSIICDRT